MRAAPKIYALCALAGLMSSGYGVLFTVLDDIRSRYHIPGEALGWVVGIGFLASFAAQLALAPIADRGHAKLMVLTGSLLNLFGLMMMAVATSLGPLIAGRLLTGLGAGCAYPAIKRLVVLSDPAHLGHNLGLVIAADVTGFALGPALSALVVDPLGLAAPFLIIGALNAAYLPFLARLDVDDHVAPSDASDRRLGLDLLSIPGVRAAAMMGSALYMMFGAFDALWALVNDDLGTSVWMANLGVTVFAIPFVVLGAWGGRLTQRVGPFRMGAAGLVVGACYMTGYGFAGSGVVMLTIAVVHAVSDGITISSASIAVGLVAPPSRQAAAHGVLGGVQTLAGGVAAVIAGWVYDSAGRRAAYVGCAVVMAALALGALATAGSHRRLRHTPEPVAV